MKKSLKIIFGIFCVLYLSIFTSWFIYRYHIDGPMSDLEYKKAILRDSHNLMYTLEALRPVMGPDELREFIGQNDEIPEIYTPSRKNLAEGIYRANLHMHTTQSDGEAEVKERMDSVQEYAQKQIKDGYMIIAITDHNTVNGAKEIIRVLEHNKGKYNNIKIVPGMEITTEYHNSKIVDKEVQIHVLAWCINPYDKFLNEEFYKADPNDKGNQKFPVRDFDWVIGKISEYGIVGVAHPARYTTFMKEKKYPYITEMLTRYSQLSKNTLFTEGYYQSYLVTSTGPHLGTEYDKYINYINSEAKKLGITRTGSTDAHGKDFYKYR